MGCSCGDHTDERAQKQVDELLDSVGMKEVFEQGDTAIRQAGEAVDELNRSERARSLGFGSDIVAVYAEAAERANRRAQEQAGALLARIDHVLQGDDWTGQVERVQAAFREHRGAQKLADLREDFRLQLLEADEHVRASTAELALACLDSAIKAASDGDLNQLVGHIRAVMESAQRGFADPEMGRQPLGHGLFDDLVGGGGPPPIGGGQAAGWCVLLAACIAWAISSMLFCIFACMAVPFCWCCFAGGCILTGGIHSALCSVAFAQRCSTG
jgi:hypothetical protein